MNGEEDEAVKVVQEMKERIETQEPASPTPGEDFKVEEDDSGSGEIIDAEDDEDGAKNDSAEDKVEVKPRRGRSSKKKA